MSVLPQIIMVAAVCLPQDSNADRIKEIKSELRDHGVRVASTYVALKSESDLRNGLSKVRKLKSAMIKADKQLAAAEKQVDQNRSVMTQLTAANVELNANLARVTVGDVATNNKLVGMINSNNSRLELLNEQRKKLKEATRKVRATTNQAREDYVSHILSLRAIETTVRDAYKAMDENSEVESLVSELSKLSERAFELAPSRSFESSVRQLEKLEETVLTQAIKLRREQDTFFVSVVVNGKAREMILDSGSSFIALPWLVAKDLGVKVKPSDKPIRLQLADGRIISGTQVVLSQVRVGGFSLDKVEAAVLGPEAKAAQPLLGMSFLKHFKFEIKTNESTLSLVRPETTRSSLKSRQ